MVICDQMAYISIFHCTGLRICQNVALGLGNVFPKFLARISLKIQGKSSFFMFGLRIFLFGFSRESPYKRLVPIFSPTINPNLWKKQGCPVQVWRFRFPVHRFRFTTRSGSTGSGSQPVLVRKGVSAFEPLPSFCRAWQLRMVKVWSSKVLRNIQKL